MLYPKKKDFFINKLPTFRVTPDNYWQAVDMVSVLDEKQVYLNPQLNMPVISTRKFGFSVRVGEINSFDGTSNKGIRNIAYKEQRSYYFCGLRGIPAANQ